MSFLDSFDPSGLVSSALGYIGTQDTNASREAIAQQANAFSAQQYATRYQTQVKDMEKAGLNPMLSYFNGAPPGPTGQQAQIDNPTASALDAYQKSSERNLISAQVQKVNSDTKVNQEQAKLIAQQVEESKSRERQADTSATANVYNTWSQQQVTNPTQKALAASYWSQVKVNEANLPKIVSEIVSNGAFAAQARALASKAVADGNLARAALEGALNEAAFERSSIGKASRFINYGVNSAGKIAEIVRPRSVPGSMPKSSSDYPKGSSYEVKPSSWHKTVFGKP